MSDPEQTLRRFARQIRSVARKATDEFAPNIELDDAEQEARVLILSYAGLVPDWHFNALEKVEEQARGDDKRVKRIVYSKLKLDLYRKLGRHHLDQAAANISPEELPPDHEPSYRPEDKWISRLDLRGYVRETYPYLYMHVIEEIPLGEIARKTEEAARTVDRRIAAEKHKAQSDPYFTESIKRQR